MTREEKKEWLNNNKHKIKITFCCGGLNCYKCIFDKEGIENCFKAREECREIMEEIWAEANGYFKKESMPKVNEEFISELVTLLYCNIFPLLANGRLPRLKDNWQESYKENPEKFWNDWLNENLFVDANEKVEVNNEETVPINLGEPQLITKEQFPFEYIPVSDLTIPIPQPTTPELKWGFLKETLKVLIQEERSQAQKEAYQKMLKIMDGFDGVA